MTEARTGGAARERLLATLDKVPAGVAILRGPDLVYEYANEAYHSFVPSAEIGKPFGQLTAQGQRFRALALQALETGEPMRRSQIQIEDLGSAHERRWFDLTLQPTRAEGPGGDAVILLGVDVTELVEARRALESEMERARFAEQQLQAVLANAPILLFAFDREGRYTMTAGGEAGEPGHGPEGLAGQSFWQHHQGEPLLLEHARRALAGETVVAQVRRGPRAFEERFTPLRGKDGSLQGVIGVSVDATSRVEAEEERERLQTKMQQAQKLESLGVLAGGVAHDFNNLLTVIQGNVSLAIARLGPPSAGAGPEANSAAPLLEDALKASQRAAELTRQMLAYSGRARFQIRPLDLGAQARELAGLWRSSISRKVELRVEVAPSLPTIQGDAAQMQQVLTNLVVNGAEAMGEAAGEVVVSLDTHELGEELAGDLYGQERLPPGRYVRLSVADTGAGMDEATLARIFDPFFTTKATGRGLGLAALLGIVRSHHGAVRIRSQPGAGTKFEVLLPAAGARALAPNPGRAAGSAGGTVLVIDDEAFVRRATCRMLASLGYDVLEAADGPAGLELYRARRGTVDAVVLDLTMPKMSGAETLVELRRLDPDVRVVVASGYAEAEVYERLGPAGTAPILSKPFTAREMDAALRSLLED